MVTLDAGADATIGNRIPGEELTPERETCELHYHLLKLRSANSLGVKELSNSRQSTIHNSYIERENFYLLLPKETIYPLLTCAELFTYVRNKVEKNLAKFDSKLRIESMQLRKCPTNYGFYINILLSERSLNINNKTISNLPIESQHYS